MLSYKAKTGLELPIFGVYGKLELFQTTAKDRMSGVVRCLPSQSCRLYGKNAFNIVTFKSLCPVMAIDSQSDAEWRSRGQTEPEVHASFIQNLFRGRKVDKEDENAPKKKSLSANPRGAKSSQPKQGIIPSHLHYMNVEPPQLKQHDFALPTEDQETKDSFTYKETEGTSGVVEVD